MNRAGLIAVFGFEPRRHIGATWVNLEGRQQGIICVQVRMSAGVEGGGVQSSPEIRKLFRGTFRHHLKSNEASCYE